MDGNALGLLVALSVAFLFLLTMWAVAMFHPVDWDDTTEVRMLGGLVALIGTFMVLIRLT